MSNPLQLKATLEWVNMPTDGKICYACKTVIASKEMWQFIVFINYEPIETKMNLCESCYEAMNGKNSLTGP